MIYNKRAHNVYNDVLRCEAPPPNLNPPIFLFRPLGTKPPNLMTANISGYTVFAIVTVPVPCVGTESIDTCISIYTIKSNIGLLL